MPKHTDDSRCKISGAIKQAWREGRYDNRNKRERWDRWTLNMDRFLEKVAGKLTPLEIAQEIEDQYGVPRTEKAIRSRMAYLGISVLTTSYMTVSRVAKIMGVMDCTALSWVRRGLIKGIQMHEGMPHSIWLIKPTDLEQFIRDHPEIYDIKKMPQTLWRGLAEVTQSKDPLLSLEDVARILNSKTSTLHDHIRRGWVEGVPRLNSYGRPRKWFIKRSQLTKLFQLGRWPEQTSTPYSLLESVPA